MGDPQSAESDPDRIDRNLIELLNELRITGTGIQVLLAFLVIVPFDSGYRTISQFDKDVYFVALLTIAAAAVLLIAPSVHHRLLFHQGQRAYIVRTANTFAIVGMALLAVGLVAILVLLSNIVFGSAAALIVGVLTAGLVGVLWFGLPGLKRLRG
jgi:uncharacterized membrane protein YiaA